MGAWNVYLSFQGPHGSDAYSAGLLLSAATIGGIDGPHSFGVGFDLGTLGHIHIAGIEADDRASAYGRAIDEAALILGDSWAVVADPLIPTEGRAVGAG